MNNSNFNTVLKKNYILKNDYSFIFKVTESIDNKVEILEFEVIDNNINLRMATNLKILKCKDSKFYEQIYNLVKNEI